MKALLAQVEAQYQKQLPYVTHSGNYTRRICSDQEVVVLTIKLSYHSKAA